MTVLRSSSPQRSSRFVRLSLASLLALGLSACAEDVGAPARNQGLNAGTFAATAGTTGYTAGTGGGVAGTGAAGHGGTGEFGGGRATLGSTPMPCDVASIVKLRCQSCHGATPLAGVPMALMSWEDLDAPSTGDPTMKVRDVVAARLVNSAAPMPPSPSPMLAGEELSTMQSWLAGGGLAGTDPSCAPVVDKTPTYEGEIPPFADNCYEIRAHANGDWETPLTVEGEHYGTFYFDAPWPDHAQGVYFETLYGDHPEVLHHWLIYADENGNSPDGAVNYPGFGSHPTSPTLVAGWAPGADNNDFPDDVGLQLAGANRKMLMEIHFFDAPGQPKVTDAGVKICTVEKAERLRPNLATISWLGTELGINIPAYAQDSTATGVCNPLWPTGVNEIHILRSWPHMHLMGRKMRSTIIRADGAREDMHSGDGWPFDFNNEVSWKTEHVLRPGDKIETTCHFTSDKPYPVQVGFENHFEMCFNFTMAYPAKALRSPIVSSLTGSSTSCL